MEFFPLFLCNCTIKLSLVTIFFMGVLRSPQGGSPKFTFQEPWQVGYQIEGNFILITEAELLFLIIK